MKKTTIALILILALLFSTVPCTQLFGLAAANPFELAGTVPPKPGTIPPSITVGTPENNSFYTTNQISLTFNVTLPQSNIASATGISYVSYNADWKEKTVNIYNPEGMATGLMYHEGASPLCTFKDGVDCFKFDFYGIPEGNHSITIQAVGECQYHEDNIIWIDNFFIDSAPSIVNFTIDTIAPAVSVISMENQTYDSSDVPLSFAVNETTSQITYSLDGQQNMTAVENTILTNLPNGVHNVTVYARDPAGNVGTSQTTTFTVANEPEPEPFPITLVTTTSAALIAAIGAAGLIIYFKKRKSHNK
jgi:hypothetical protein